MPLLSSCKSVQTNLESFEPLPDIRLEDRIKPPGVLNEEQFRARCTGCGVCINVCHVMKYDALTPSSISLSRGISSLVDFGLPYVKNMRDFPCSLCMECPQHCPTGALMPIAKEDVKMGMALIDLGLCFGWNGDVCLSCSKACPLGASVFDFYNGEWGNQPFINERCVGCGLCVKYCPLGGSAIKVVSKRQYEKIRNQYHKNFNMVLKMSMEERYNLVYNKNLPEIMARGRIIEREYR
ncbi:MAG: 4Fe-4S binding protein [Thermodesulfovibrionales bacterium]|nr:4Fe-4S binding protein [Thermodesulfovibrionales bacterium]